MSLGEPRFPGPGPEIGRAGRDGWSVTRIVITTLRASREAWRRLRAWRRISFSSGGLAFTLGTMAVGLAAMNTGNNLLYLLLGSMLGFITVSGWLSEQAIRGLNIERRHPRAVTVGHDFRLVYEVTNAKTRLPGRAVEMSETGLAESAVLALDPPLPGRAFAISLRRSANRRSDRKTSQTGSVLNDISRR